MARDEGRSRRGYLTRRAVAALLLAFAAAAPVLARDVSPFPPQLDLAADGELHRLALTGEAARVFLVFRVYDMAHYIDVAAAGLPLSPASVVTDGPSKAIAINFSRKLGRDQIREEFRRSLRRNAEADWLERARTSIDAFVQAIDRGARPGDRLTFFWLAGGRLLTDFNGERVFSVTDADFARLIWSIWFGAEPACDSGQLLARVASASADD